MTNSANGSIFNDPFFQCLDCAETLATNLPFLPSGPSFHTLRAEDITAPSTFSSMACARHISRYVGSAQPSFSSAIANSLSSIVCGISASSSPLSFSKGNKGLSYTLLCSALQRNCKQPRRSHSSTQFFSPRQIGRRRLPIATSCPQQPCQLVLWHCWR